MILKTKEDLSRAFKADTGFYPENQPKNYAKWVEEKYLELVNKKITVDFGDLEGLEG